MTTFPELRPLTPVYTSPLFQPLSDELVSLIRSLSSDDYDRPATGSWRVRDVVAHLLHGDLRELSSTRDDPSNSGQENDPHYEEVVSLINRDNDEGVRFLSRFSPLVLGDILEVTGRAVAKLFNELDPHQVARTAVLWAGESVSEVWMDMGREYTERWHHQLQIRDAVGAPLLLDDRWVDPILDLSVRALPRAFGARLTASPHTSVSLIIREGGPKAWTVTGEAYDWRVRRGALSHPDASLTMSTDTAWRLFFGMLTPPEIESRVEIAGPRWLVEPIFEARSVMI